MTVRMGYDFANIKQFDGRNVKLTSMPSAATIDQHPLSHVLIYFSQNLKAAKLVKYDKYWEVTHEDKNAH